jgi:ribosomal protein S18 acetylase RimI-like enzyme
VRLRPCTAGELAAGLAAPLDEGIPFVDAASFRTELAAGRYRPAWTWVAEDRGRILARALWWGRADSPHPLALDCLALLGPAEDPTALGSALLRAGHDALGRRPSWDLVLRPGWRDDPAAAAATAWRREAAARAGLTEALERHRFVWTPIAGVPPASTRLRFAAEPDDDVFLDAFRRIGEGSLDVTTRRGVAAHGAAAQARDELDFYRGMPSDRAWWRVASTPGGERVGIAIPGATPTARNVSFIGVLPEQRGHGYVDDLLGEVTRVHAAAGAPRITATADVTNQPMAAAFERAGYACDELRLVLSAPG